MKKIKKYFSELFRSRLKALENLYIFTLKLIKYIITRSKERRSRAIYSSRLTRINSRRGGTEEVNNGKYKLTAAQAEEKINALFEEREEKNNENPEQARPVIWEEILLALDITKNTWDSWKDYNPDDIPNKNSKEYSVYIDKIYMAELIKKTEARLAMHIQLLGMQNPKLSSYCIWLQKQKHYGGYTDRQEVLTTGDVKISVKLTDDKGKSI